MTNKVNSSLRPATGSIDVAANDDVPGSTTMTPVSRQDDPEYGWDPFEVWRTRVKEARERPVSFSSGRSKD